MTRVDGPLSYGRCRLSTIRSEVVVEPNERFRDVDVVQQL